MRICWTMILFLGVLVCGGCEQVGRVKMGGMEEVKKPRVFYLDGAAMVRTRERVRAGDPTLKPALYDFLGEAKWSLTARPRSVMDKVRIGPSGDKHDYVSYARYFWPDPTKKDGLPYVSRDGYSNNELIREGDADEFKGVIWNVWKLSLAYWFTEDGKYSTHAGELLRVWFLNPATRMNPNFQFAQAVPGKLDGRGYGLIEFRGMFQLVDSLGLLEGAPGWTEADAAGMHSWMEEYAKWVRTSKEANDEHNEGNNHGSWMAAHESALYLYLGDEALARAVFATIPGRIAKQIEPDGQQPLELAREDGLSYSVMNLTGLAVTAILAKHEGIDLWHYETKDGRSITRALKMLLPVFTGEKNWEWKQRARYGLSDPLELVLQATMVFKDGGYEGYLAKLRKGQVESRWEQLIYGGR